MDEKQANEVLRAVAARALEMLPYLYGQYHEKAAELIKEALTVNKVACNLQEASLVSS